MPEEIMSGTGTGILIAAVAGLIYALTNLVNKAGPNLINAWLNAKIKAEEYKRTREAAAITGQNEMFGEILQSFRDDRREDREERRADREESAKQRRQNLKLIESVSQLGHRVGQLASNMNIFGQHMAQVEDRLEKVERAVSGND